MFEKFRTWYRDPFDADMGVTGWFLFVGMLIAVMVMWRLILSHIIRVVD